jgi:ubiquinone/menaquinone biosynthesis C-methylase UbiE
MDDVEFQRILATPLSRATNYRGAVNAFYERVTDTFREKWGESFHFAVFKGQESLEEALVAMEGWVADEASFRPGMEILDVGCGVGGPALNIAQHSGAHITGVNIVERHLEVARRRAAERGLSDRVRFELADAMDMPFPDTSFDAVYVFEAGCHMPDKPRFYRECARVLRPGGVFTGTEWLRREGLTPAEEREQIEPICRLNAVPWIDTLSELGGHLTAAGVEVEVLEDLSRHGDILRNWELVDRKSVQGIRRLLPWLISPTLRMLVENGTAVCRGARLGSFLVGYWRARKPGAA